MSEREGATNPSRSSRDFGTTFANVRIKNPQQKPVLFKTYRQEKTDSLVRTVLSNTVPYILAI